MKNTLGLFLILFILFSCEKKHDISFNNLYDEVVNTKGDETELRKILEREKKNYSQSKSLKGELFYKYIESFLIKDKIERVTKLYEIDLLNNGQYEDATLIFDFHMSEELQQTSPVMFLKFLDEAIQIEEKNNSTKFLPHLYHLKGKYFYRKKEYSKAIALYNKAYQIFKKENNVTYQASMFNNIGLCYDKMKNYTLSDTYFDKALLLANKEKGEKKDISFINNVLLNKAQSDFLQKKYSDAEIIFQQFFNDYREKNNFDFYYISFASRLFDIYAETKQNNKIEKLISEIIKNKYEELHSQIAFHRIMVKYNILNNNNSLAKKYFTELALKEDEFKKLNDEEYQKLTSNLEDKILENQKKENIREYEKMRNKNFLTILLLLFFFASIIYYMWVEKIKSKNKKRLIEQENIYHKEKIKNQKLLIEIKNNAEQNLLTKVKELRKKNKGLPSDIEEVVREIYLNINNIVEINKKNNNLSGNIDYTDSNLNKLKKALPQLSDLEIRLCNYYDLKLSSKEISFLENLTEGTVRVYRNKIKKKLGLNPNDDLEQFLKNIHARKGF